MARSIANGYYQGADIDKAIFPPAIARKITMKSMKDMKKSVHMTLESCQRADAPVLRSFLFATAALYALRLQVLHALHGKIKLG
jgi:hypothetical protein